MKLASLVFACILASNLLATSQSKKTKVKNSINKAADSIDKSTRKVIDKSKEVWKKHKIKNERAQEGH